MSKLVKVLDELDRELDDLLTNCDSISEAINANQKELNSSLEELDMLRNQLISGFEERQQFYNERRFVLNIL